MKLTAYEYGTTEINEAMAFADGNPEKKCPIALLFFMIEADGKKILVDVGCDTMPGYPLFTHKSPVHVLEECGVSRNDITDIILTHAHHDHIEAITYYPHAAIHIHKDALPFAHKWLENMPNIKPFSSDFEFCKGVFIKHIGGHAEGSSIVLVDGGDKITALCGDECYLRENLITKKETAYYYDRQRSIDFVLEYSKDKYNTILFHELGLVGNIGCKVLLCN